MDCGGGETSAGGGQNTGGLVTMATDGVERAVVEATAGLCHGRRFQHRQRASMLPAPAPGQAQAQAHPQRPPDDGGGGVRLGRAWHACAASGQGLRWLAPCRALGCEISKGRLRLIKARVPARAAVSPSNARPASNPVSPYKHLRIPRSGSLAITLIAPSIAPCS